MADLVGAVDQGTTSTRFMIFDHAGAEVARHQLEHTQIMPRPGWVEHDPAEIWERTRTVIETTLRRAGLRAADLAAVGLTNQRETTLVWNRRTGRPYGNAIVWQDTRTDRIAAALDRDGRGDVIRHKAGLPPATYFSGGKLQWMLDNIDGLRADAERGEALFGTADTWLLWNLTGGVHVTDVTNASRTMLMDLRTLDWDDELLGFFGIPRPMLPQIRPSSVPEPYGTTAPDGPFGGELPVTGILGDQQAATVGQVCFAPGEAKNTYGTGNFLLLNTGTDIVRSKAGLLTTVAFKFGADPAVYALEGSIAVTGSAVQWLRDQLGIISAASDSEVLAAQVDDTEGCYFVPAFSGLFAPYWRADARGADRRPVPLPHRRAPGPRHPGGHLLPEPGRGRGDGTGLGRPPGGAQGGRRGDRQRPGHAAAGRYPRRPGEPPGRGRDHRPRRRLRGRPGHRLLAGHRRAARQLARVQALDPLLDRGPPRRRLRRLAQGRPAHPRLGRSRFIPNDDSARPATTACPAPPVPRPHRAPRSTAPRPAPRAPPRPAPSSPLRPSPRMHPAPRRAPSARAPRHPLPHNPLVHPLAVPLLSSWVLLAAKQSRPDTRDRPIVRRFWSL